MRLADFSDWSNTYMYNYVSPGNTDSWRQQDVDDSAVPSSFISPHHLIMDTPTYTGSSNSAAVVPSNSASNRNVFETPPRSPPVDDGLDDLVADIPEILDSPSYHSEFRDILNDLESTHLETRTSFDNVVIPSLNSPPYTMEAQPSPTPRFIHQGQILKKDIMWGGYDNCSSYAVPNRLRHISDTDEGRFLEMPSKNSVFYEDEEEHLPDTPSSCNTDGDDPDIDNEADTSTMTVRSEHDYCGKMSNDSDEEVDVVTCSDKKSPSLISGPSSPRNMKSRSIRSSVPAPMISPEVKRQLQITIQESMKNKQQRKCNQVLFTESKGRTPTLGEMPPPPAPTYNISAPVAGSTNLGSNNSSLSRTQGKPAAYTKRMREYHSEVLKSNKKRKTKAGDNEEGRRTVHNTLERQRRVDLRNSFENVRLQVPETKNLDKAPKVTILNKARAYCIELKDKEVTLLDQKENLRRTIELLERKLTSLY